MAASPDHGEDVGLRLGHLGDPGYPVVIRVGDAGWIGVLAAIVVDRQRSAVVGRLEQACFVHVTRLGSRGCGDVFEGTWTPPWGDRRGRPARVDRALESE